jgi:hypothetical protein
MKEIAIKGDSFRKNAVIHALIHIGGYNPYDFTGEREDCYYVLNSNDIIEEVRKPNEERVLLFTLDQFREKFIQRGDVVRNGDKLLVVTDVRWLSMIGTMYYETIEAANLKCFGFTDKDKVLGRTLRDYTIKQL